MTFEITTEVAHAFFSKHRDIPLAPLKTGGHEGMCCPLAVIAFSLGGFPNPSACSLFWAEEFTDGSTQHPLDPTLGHFVHLVDRSGISWEAMTGQQANDLLDRAEREIAAGASPGEWVSR